MKKELIDQIPKIKNCSYDAISLTSISGDKVIINKTCEVELNFGGKLLKQKVFVTDSCWAFESPVIIGIDTIRNHGLIYNPITETVSQIGGKWDLKTINNEKYSINNALSAVSCALITPDNIRVNGNTAKKLKLRLNWPMPNHIFDNKILVLQPTNFANKDHAWHLENAIVSAIDGMVTTYILNTTDQDLLIPKNKMVATVTVLEEKEPIFCPECIGIDKMLKEIEVQIMEAVHSKVDELRNKLNERNSEKFSSEDSDSNNDSNLVNVEQKLHKYQEKLIISAVSKRNQLLRRGHKEEKILEMTKAREKIEGLSTKDVSEPEKPQSRLEQLLSSVNLSHLGEKEKSIFTDLITRYAHVFALNAKEMSCVPNYKHKINTEDHKPICKRPYRVSRVEMELQKSHIQELLDAELIIPSDSPWSTGCVIVSKSNGTSRLCIDYRELNAITVPDDYPMPHVTEILQQLGGNKVFSTLDCNAGFHSLAIDENDIPKLAFSTVFGKYTFVRLPFGLRNAPSAFQRVMDNVLCSKTYKTLFVYMDDIIIFTKTLEEHIKELEEIFMLLYKNGLRLKPSKCCFAKTHLEYLGHVVSAEGIHPNEQKIKALRDFPSPICVSDVQSFMGLVNYYRKFINKCAEYSIPLNKLLRKDTKFEWTPECETSFNYFKSVLISDAVLVHPDPDKRFYLAVDASDYSCGGVLQQKDDEGNFRPVWYISRSLSGHEQNYTTTEKELLAMIYCILQCKCLLYGKAFTVYTDHVALKWMFSLKAPSQRICRWSEKLRDFTIDVQHRSGKKNQLADCLSRSRQGQVDRTKEIYRNPNITFSYDKDSTEPIVEVIVDPQQKPILAVLKSKQLERNKLDRRVAKKVLEIEREKSLEKSLGVLTSDSFTIDYTWFDLYKQQRSCEWAKEVIEYLEKEQKNILKPNDDKPKIMEKLEFYLDENSILRLITRKHGRPRIEPLDRLVVVDLNHQMQIMYLHHDTIFSGHFGSEKTYEKIKTSYYWPLMKLDINEYCKSCLVCQQFKTNPRGKRSLQHMPTPTRPWEFTAIDLKGPLQTTFLGNKYALVFVDYLTKYVEAIPIKDKTASTVARCFVDNIITRYTTPKILLSDLGKEFIGKVFRETCQILGIKRLYTTGYHPQTNGQVERMNRTISGVLTPFINEFQNNWDELLPLALCCIRNSVSKATGETPTYMLMGMDSGLPVHSMLEPIKKKYSVDSHYPDELVTSLKLVHQNVTKSLEEYKEANERRREKIARNIPFEIGQLVLLYTPKVKQGTSAKLTKMNTGPYRITDKFSDHVFEITHYADKADVRKVNAHRLKPYNERKTFLTPDLLDPVEVTVQLGYSSSEDEEFTQTTQDPVMEQLDLLDSRPKKPRMRTVMVPQKVVESVQKPVEQINTSNLKFSKEKLLPKQTVKDCRVILKRLPDVTNVTKAKDIETLINRQTDKDKDLNKNENVITKQIDIPINVTKNKDIETSIDRQINGDQDSDKDKELIPDSGSEQLNESFQTLEENNETDPKKLLTKLMDDLDIAETIEINNESKGSESEDDNPDISIVKTNLETQNNSSQSEPDSGDEMLQENEPTEVESEHRDSENQSDSEIDVGKTHKRPNSEAKASQSDNNDKTDSETEPNKSLIEGEETREQIPKIKKKIKLTSPKYEDRRPPPGVNPHATRSKGAKGVVLVEHCLRTAGDAVRSEHTPLTKQSASVKQKENVKVAEGLDKNKKDLGGKVETKGKDQSSKPEADKKSGGSGLVQNVFQTVVDLIDHVADQ